MSSYKITSDNKRWYSDPRLIVLIMHTILATSIIWARDPSDPWHSILSIEFLLDFPAYMIWYCGAWLVRSLGLSSNAYFTDPYIHYISITLLGGLQWVLIVWVCMWHSANQKKKEVFCRKCSYNFTGNESGVCPECGTTIKTMKYYRKKRLPVWLCILICILLLPVSYILSFGFMLTFRIFVLSLLMNYLPKPLSDSYYLLFDIIKYTLLIVFTVIIYKKLRWKIVDPADLKYCFQCDYDLTGNVSGVCPECGTEIKP